MRALTKVPVLGARWPIRYAGGSIGLKKGCRQWGFDEAVCRGFESVNATAGYACDALMQVGSPVVSRYREDLFHYVFFNRKLACLRIVARLDVALNIQTLRSTSERASGRRTQTPYLRVRIGY